MFKKTRSVDIPNLKCTFEEYEHECGAKHYHLRSDNNENCFLVSLPTVPTNSDGRAHILEHLALCGSKNYPTRDPFFAMNRRSLATFMNAMTYPEKTVYPFASIDKNDYFNLLDVYLDATFFPNLNYLDFKQEGWRLEVNESGALTYQGVVFNEMKGALDSSSRHYWRQIQGKLKVGTTYENESGGDPENIPDLTYEELVEFHKTHYNPSRATFMTFGDIDPKEIQNVIEQKVINNISERYKPLYPQKTNLKPGTYSARCPIPFSAQAGEMMSESGEIVDSNEYSLVLNWLIGSGTDEQTQDYKILGQIIFGEGADLSNALSSAGFGRPSNFNYISSDELDATMHLGMDGLKKKEIARAKKLILEELELLAKNGIAKEHVSAAFRDLEMSVKQISGGRIPYGLNLLLAGASSISYGADPLNEINPEPYLERARKRFEEPGYIQKMVQKLLKEAPLYEIEFYPDGKYFERKKALEQKKLKDLQSSLSPEQLVQIKKEQEQLVQRQSETPNVDCLPMIDPQSVSRKVRSALPLVKDLGNGKGGPSGVYVDSATNGIGYIGVRLDLSKLSKEEWQWLDFASSIMMSMPDNNLNWQQATMRRNLLTSTLSVSVNAPVHVKSSHMISPFFSVTASSLDRELSGSVKAIEELLGNVNFNDPERLKFLVNSMYSSVQKSLTDMGPQLASSMVQSSISSSGWFSENNSGMNGIVFLMKIMKQLQTSSGTDWVIDNLTKSIELLRSCPAMTYGVGGVNALNAKNDLQVALGYLSADDVLVHKQVDVREHYNKVRDNLIIAPSNVNYCYQSIGTCNVLDKDSVYLELFAKLLTNERLHSSLREKGGAYGGGASYSPLAGTFTMSTYRDPNVQNSYKEFANALNWGKEADFSKKSLDEAKLGFLAQFEKPEVPKDQGFSSMSQQMSGMTEKLRQERKERIIDATSEDIVQAAVRQLNTENTSRCAFITEEKFSQIQSEGHDGHVHHLKDVLTFPVGQRMKI